MSDEIRYPNGITAVAVAIVDATGAQITSLGNSSSSSSGAPVATFNAGQAKIATSGQFQELAAAAEANSVTLIAAPTNANPITIRNDNTVTATHDGTGNGFPLFPGATVTLNITNLNEVFINGTAADWLGYVGN